MSAPPTTAAPVRDPLRECLLLWVLAIGGIALGKWVLDPLFGGFLAPIPLLDGLFHPKTIAAVLFLYLPVLAMKPRDEYPEDYGLTRRGWPRALRLYLAMSLAVLPLYVLGYWGFVRSLPLLPPRLAHVLAPYGAAARFSFHWPARFPLKVVDQLLVVALPEELFYRGYLQQRLKLTFGPGRPFLGIRVGRAFLLTQVLFALGHLVEPYPWRLAVFFPALLFGWLRERSDTLPAGILFHASCNLTVMVLEASFFPLH